MDATRHVKSLDIEQARLSIASSKYSSLTRKFHFQGETEKSKEMQNGEDEGDEVAILGESDQEFWIRSARRVSYASIAFTLVGGVTGIILSVVTDRLSTTLLMQKDE